MQPQYMCVHMYECACVCVCVCICATGERENVNANGTKCKQLVNLVKAIYYRNYLCVLQLFSKLDVMSKKTPVSINGAATMENYMAMFQEIKDRITNE